MLFVSPLSLPLAPSLYLFLYPLTLALSPILSPSLPQPLSFFQSLFFSLSISLSLPLSTSLYLHLSLPDLPLGLRLIQDQRDSRSANKQLWPNRPVLASVTDLRGNTDRCDVSLRCLHPARASEGASPLNLTSSSSWTFSSMSPLGLKVWQGQCTLISRPRLVSG